MHSPEYAESDWPFDEGYNQLDKEASFCFLANLKNTYASRCPTLTFCLEGYIYVPFGKVYKAIEKRNFM